MAETEFQKRPKGAEVDVWGVYCRHGARVVENDPASYPVGRIVDPWPCLAGCAPSQFECNWQERWTRYYDTLIGPVSPRTVHVDHEGDHRFYLWEPLHEDARSGVSAEGDGR